MITTERAFRIAMYEEYLEEASFLYGQRLQWMQSAAVGWTKIEEFEDRLEAHLDGLVVGGNLALEVCERRAQEGDCGEFYAAIRVFCRQARKSSGLGLLRGLNPNDHPRVQAARQALNVELPSDWHDDLCALAQTGPVLACTVMRVFGYRRVTAAANLFSILREKLEQSPVDLVWTAGRIGHPTMNGYLGRFLGAPEVCVQHETAIALLRLGDGYPRGAGATIPSGLAGNRSTAQNLIKSNARLPPGESSLLALGLLGDVVAVPALLEQLADEKAAVTAVESLELITGAGLLEQTFLPDEIEDDEMFEEESDKVSQGEQLRRGDGKPFGTTVVRLSQKPAEWCEWWVRNAAAFDSKLRYRNGKLYSPLTLLESLENPHTPYKLRQLAYEELFIRYGMDIPFEADMLVSDQRKALARMAAWIHASNGSFREGLWYLHGRPQY